MNAACATSRVNDRFQEPLYLFLELLRAGVIHGNRPEGESSMELLIMRCISILPLSFRVSWQWFKLIQNQQWAGPLSRELLTFNSFVRAISKAMRQVLEAIGVHIVLSGDAKRVRDDYLDILVSLPFQAETNTGFGILIKTYLDAATFHNGDDITLENAKSESVANAKREALSFIEQSFSSVKTPLQEVERGFRFWDTVSRR
jgi:hypothetical protein